MDDQIFKREWVERCLCSTTPVREGDTVISKLEAEESRLREEVMAKPKGKRKPIEAEDVIHVRKINDPLLSIEDCDLNLACLRDAMLKARRMDPPSVRAIERVIDDWLDKRSTLVQCDGLERALVTNCVNCEGNSEMIEAREE